MNIKNNTILPKRIGRHVEIGLTGINVCPEDITVYRVHDEAFEFGTHYWKYFNSQSFPTGAAAYSGGTFCCTSDNGLIYRDAAVDVGNTYVYWLETADGKRLGPMPVKLRDPEIWWPYSAIEQRLEAIARRHSDAVEYKRFGRSAGDRDIAGLIAGNRENLIGVIGLIHPGESGPELMIPAFERLLEDRELLSQAGIAILPNVNPDERERNALGVPYYLRKNSRGVDINRNFPSDWEIVNEMYNQRTDDPTSGTYRGEAPASEPETQAVMAFVEATRPKAVFCYHSVASICGAAFLGAGAACEDKHYIDTCRGFTQAYTEGMYPDEDRQLKMPFKTAPGSLPLWLYRSRGIPAFDLEHDGNAESKPALNDRTGTQLLGLYQERHHRGVRQVLRLLAEKDTRAGQ